MISTVSPLVAREVRMVLSFVSIVSESIVLHKKDFLRMLYAFMETFIMNVKYKVIFAKNCISVL